MSSTALRLRTLGVSILIGVLFAALGINSAIAQDRTSVRGGQATLDKLDALRIENAQPIYRSALDVAQNKISPALSGSSGRTQIVIRLSKPSVAEISSALYGGAASHKVNVMDEQAGFIARCGAMAPDMKE